MFHKTFRNFLIGIGLLALVAVSGVSIAQAQVEKIGVCHENVTDPPQYSFLEIPPAALGAHFDEHGNPIEGHDNDFFSEDGDCDRNNDPGPTPTPGTDPVPEPITMILFGAGLAGVGYVTRRFRKGKGSDTIED